MSKSIKHTLASLNESIMNVVHGKEQIDEAKIDRASLNMLMKQLNKAEMELKTFTSQLSTITFKSKVNNSVISNFGSEAFKLLKKLSAVESELKKLK